MDPFCHSLNHRSLKMGRLMHHEQIPIDNCRVYFTKIFWNRRSWNETRRRGILGRYKSARKFLFVDAAGNLVAKRSFPSSPVWRPVHTTCVSQVHTTLPHVITCLRCTWLFSPRCTRVQSARSPQFEYPRFNVPLDRRLSDTSQKASSITHTHTHTDVRKGLQLTCLNLT